MEPNNSTEKLASKRQIIIFFIAYIIGGFPWWVWVKPIVPASSEYWLLLIQIPAFLYVIFSAWILLGKFHGLAIKAVKDSMEGQRFKDDAYKLLKDADNKNYEAKLKLKEAETVVAKARQKYSSEQ